MVLREERALYIHSHLQSLPDRDSNWQLFDYESNSLTIRPWLPQVGAPVRFSYIILIKMTKKKCFNMDTIKLTFNV